MKNNIYQIEPFKKRLDRLQNGSPIESIETLLNSIANFFNNEIVLTPEKYQTSLLFLGIHSVALTIAEIFWGLKGEAGFKKFLETFMDGEVEHKRFSLVADKIHNWRNVLAHQWLASSGYKIHYDYNMEFGFVINNDLLSINPQIYCNSYMKAFSSSGKIWQYKNLLSSKELEESKLRIVNKFLQK